LEHHIIKTIEEFHQLKEYVDINTYSFLALDTETDSVIEKKAKLYGVGLCFEENEAFYIPIRHKDTTKYWTAEQEESIKDWIYKQSLSKKLVGHNIIYDILVLLYNWNINLTDHIYADTILQKHTLNEDRPHGLKETAVKYLGAWADKAQDKLYQNIKDNGGKTNKDNVEMYKADLEVLGEYCAYDTILTMKLFNLFEPKLKLENLDKLFYVDEIMPLYKEVTIPMKIQGFPIDVEYFKDLNFNISKEIENLEKKTQEDLAPLTRQYVAELLKEQHPPKRSGLFPKHAATLIGFTLPEKNGKVTLAKKEIDKIQEPETEEHRNFLHWLKEEEDLNLDLIIKTQQYWHHLENESSYIFNLKSVYDLKWLFFEKLKEKPLTFTEGNQPQVDEDFLESIKSKYEWINTLLDFKKLIKLKTTYIEGLLERHIDGVIYGSMLQFGTDSGRYSSRDPNLQNLPRVKEEDSGLSETVLKYVNGIKKGFVAGKGNLILNADYSQLEPRAFAEACGDYLLQQVFIKNEDLYGSIAKNIWNLDCTANEVKKKYPEYRQKAKVVALAVVYGAEAGRISKLMKIKYKEAQKIIDDYLDAYPGLKKYMSDCDKFVCLNGFMKTKFGRIRHLPEAKRLYKAYGFKLLDRKWAQANGLDELRWKFKNMLNLAKNFPIQGVAAHVVNRSMIATNRGFKAAGIQGCIVTMVHDELSCIIKAEDAERAKPILKACMENTVKLSVPLKADPLIAYSWDEAK